MLKRFILRVATDYCVLYTTIDALDLGLSVFVYSGLLAAGSIFMQAIVSLLCQHGPKRRQAHPFHRPYLKTNELFGIFFRPDSFNPFIFFRIYFQYIA